MSHMLGLQALCSSGRENQDQHVGRRGHQDRKLIGPKIHKADPPALQGIVLFARFSRFPG